MIFNFFRLIFAVFLVLTAIICANAQVTMPDASSRSGRSNESQEDLPKNVKETLAKSRIDRDKKQYEELIQRGEEAAQLSDELGKSFVKQNKFSSEDQKKLDRLEKLVKKIRKELGGDDDENSDEGKPSSMPTAIKTLQETTTKLVDMIKKSTRYSISVAAIESSNALLKIVRFIRFGNN